MQINFIISFRLKENFDYHHFTRFEKKKQQNVEVESS